MEGCGISQVCFSVCVQLPLRNAGEATDEGWDHQSAGKALSTKCAGSAQVTGHPQDDVCMPGGTHSQQRAQVCIAPCVECPSWRALATAWSWPSSHPGPRNFRFKYPPWQDQRAEGIGPGPAQGAFEVRCLVPNALKEARAHRFSVGGQDLPCWLRRGYPFSPLASLPCLGDGILKEIEPWPSSKMGAAGRSWRAVGRQGSVGMWYMKSNSCPEKLCIQTVGRFEDTLFALSREEPLF